MTIFSKRNAVIGWVTWLVGKRIFGRKPRAARRKPIKPAIAAAVAAIGAAVFFWRRGKHSEQPATERPATEQPTSV
jgi:hypothetical protein